MCPGVALTAIVSFPEVLAAAQSGAPWALQRLYAELSGTVLAYCRTRGAPDPEDVTSEVFLSAFTALRDFTGDEANFRAWLFTIAHRRLVDAYRQQSRRPQTAPYVGDQDARTAPSSEDEALTALATERVRDMLSDLPPDQRDVLLLRILGDLTIEAIAETLGKSEGAVKALQRRALAALRKRIEREGVSL
ncbi:MAG: RNA polymerase sigma factor [Mycobacteriales bacterium]